MNYNAAVYARASKDDPDSGTIENQIRLIREYAELNPDINIVSVKTDNGFSGIDFLRPSFAEMMREIISGKINCVIVKDLSRLGRNYIEVGELMEKIFPKYNARLIAVNDDYDSLNPRTDADEIIIPFKNLINEQYLRDSSVKIRSGLDIKRKNGDFVAAFAPYGYKRSRENKHRLSTDEPAAAVVRDIFSRKIEGQSNQKIADGLNSLGEPSPAEYKKHGTNYTTRFQTRGKALWSAVAVGRILSNPVYTGVLIQGKQTTPNYKVSRRINKPREEWRITENSHEPVIDKKTFETVRDLMSRDTRTAPNRDIVYPLSGLVYCADCKNNMVRTKSGSKIYYICASSRAKNKTCASHCISREKLENAVIKAAGFEFSLNRSLAVNLISRVEVSKDKQVSVYFRDGGDD